MADTEVSRNVHRARSEAFVQCSVLQGSVGQSDAKAEVDSSTINLDSL